MFVEGKVENIILIFDFNNEDDIFFSMDNIKLCFPYLLETAYVINCK